MKRAIGRWIFLVLIAATAPAQIGAADAWIRQNQPQTRSSLRALAVLDGRTLVAVGERGAILRTTDAGETWNIQPSGTAVTLFALSFPTSLNGTAVGESGTILRTDDGGISWRPQRAGTANALWGVSFTDADTGTAVGDKGTVLRTIDGGNTWKSLDDAWELGGLRGVFFTDTNTGIAVGGEGIYRTTNGGIGWSLEFSAKNRGTRLYSVSFADAKTGTAVGDSGTILRTTDGGLTWKEQSSGTTNTLYSVWFTDTNRGSAVGTSGTILRTMDGGMTWKMQSSSGNVAFFGVFFGNAISGWVVGIDGLVQHTITGGEPGPIAVSSASLTAPLGLNSLASLFGSGFAAAVVSAGLSSPPTSLGGISVKVRDSAGVERLARLLYVSPTQINFEVPAGTAPGAATLEIVNAPIPLLTVPAQIRDLAPGLYSLENNMAAAYALRFEPDGRQTVLPGRGMIESDDRPVYLILYGTGIRNRSSLANVRCSIGGITLPVEYAGPDGSGVPGLDQVNVRLTSALKGNRDGHLELVVDGVPANTVVVNVR